MRCDKCCARALTWWWLDSHDLDRHLCGHHSDQLAAVLVTQGWQQIADQRDELDLTPSQ